MKITDRPVANDAAKAIIKHLEKVSYGRYRQSEIFDDWLEMIEASLERLPAHAKAMSETGQMAEDTPETEKLFERMKAKYTPEDFERFGNAMAELMITAMDSYEDILGSVYMSFGYPSSGLGQYFTPWSVAYMMAQMTGIDNEQTLTQRMLDALSKTTQFPALKEMGFQLTLEYPNTVRYWFEKFIEQAAPNFEPITVCDPCCGSGIMLLASAASYPRWAVDMGLVQFFGMDIDQTCVQMAKVNMMLHGLNGYGVECADSLRNPMLQAMPIAKEVYGPAVDLLPEEKRELSFSLRNQQYAMFELPEMAMEESS